MITRYKDGSTWRIGTDAEVAWIAEGTSMDKTVTCAISALFPAYATVELPHNAAGQEEHDRAVLALLREQSAGQPWWRGDLDTGADAEAILPELREAAIELNLADVAAIDAELHVPGLRRAGEDVD